MKWDEYEKGFILPKLGLNRNKVILDLGCGMGRMADAVSDQCKEYYGVDFPSEMIAVAKQNSGNRNCHFYTMSIVDALSSSQITARQYDVVLMAGVSMYINEDELMETYRLLSRLANPGTLSENLKDYYGAINRTREEYKSLIRECMKGAEFVEEGYMDFLDKKEQSETSHWYALLKCRED